MAGKRDVNVAIAPLETGELVRKALWGLVHGISVQRTFAEMLIHSEGMEEGCAPLTGEISYMVVGMANHLELNLNLVKSFILPIETHDRVRNGLGGLTSGISAQRTFAEMLANTDDDEGGSTPSAEEIAHIVAGMAERLDLHLNHVKDFVFDLVGRARP